MHLGEALRFSFQSLRANPVRSFLTCLGMMIGNASVILVVTISQTRADTNAAADCIKQSDVNVVRSELGRRIVAVTAVMNNSDSILIDGKQRDVKVIGSDQYYKNVRNLVVPAGRFLDAGDVEQRTRVC